MENVDSPKWKLIFFTRSLSVWVCVVLVLLSKFGEFICSSCGSGVVILSLFFVSSGCACCFQLFFHPRMLLHINDLLCARIDFLLLLPSLVYIVCSVFNVWTGHENGFSVCIGERQMDLLTMWILAITVPLSSSIIIAADVRCRRLCCRHHIKTS